MNSVQQRQQSQKGVNEIYAQLRTADTSTESRARQVLQPIYVYVYRMLCVCVELCVCHRYFFRSPRFRVFAHASTIPLRAIAMLVHRIIRHIMCSGGISARTDQKPSNTRNAHNTHSSTQNIALAELLLGNSKPISQATTSTEHTLAQAKWVYPKKCLSLDNDDKLHTPNRVHALAPQLLAARSPHFGLSVGLSVGH